jgi:hypothetical protein
MPVVAVVVRLLLLVAALFAKYSAVADDTGGTLDFVFFKGAACSSMIAPVGKVGEATVELDKGRESSFVTMPVDGTEGEAGLMTVLLGCKLSSTGPDDLFLNWT